jgi:hypothetical protein
MICEECHGTGMAFGRVRGTSADHVVNIYPCPACGGTGASACCEGPTGLSCDVGNEGTSVPRGTETKGG